MIEQLLGADLGATLMRASLGGATLQIVGIGISFLAGVQLARGLGAEGLGAYSLALSLTTIVGLLGEFGIPQVALRETSAASQTKNWADLVGVATFSIVYVAVLTMAGGVALFLVTLFWGPLDPGRRNAILWGALLMPFVGQAKTLSYMLMGIGRIVAGQAVNLAVRPGLFVVLFAIAWWSADAPVTAPRAMSLQVASAVFSFLFVGLLFLRFLPTEAWSARPKWRVGAWLGAAWPMSMTEGLRVVQGQISIVLLGLLSTGTEVGLFKVADAVATICSISASLFNFVAISMFARLWAAEDLGKLQKLASTITAGIMAGTLLVTLPTIAFGRTLLPVLFSQPFVDSYPSMVVLCGVGLVYSIFGLSGSLLNMTGNERCVTRAIAASMVASLGLAAVLIPSMGAIGGALSNVVGFATWNVLTWIDARKRVGIDTSIFAVAGILREHRRTSARR